MTPSFRLSIAIPVHNEVSILPELLQRIRAVMDELPGGPHELLFVDDGSTDGTLGALEEATRHDARIVVISLSRNFGHQAALTAALDYVTGDAAVVMDGDLQDVPEAIPEFVARYNEGYDVVYARRIRRKESWALRFCYFLFYRLMATLSDIQVPLDTGDFGLMSRRVVDHLRRMPEHHRYLRGMRSWVGFRQVGIDVEHGKRSAGKSKFGILRLLKLAADGIFSFSIVPIRAAAILGFTAILFAVGYAFYAVYAKFFLHESPQGFTAIIVTVTFLSGVLLFFMGVIGEYVGRIYEETKSRPSYVVSKIIGNQQKDDFSNPSLAGRHTPVLHGEFRR
jgi:glycosyltransferase involved in cell wall biosynthesis